MIYVVFVIIGILISQASSPYLTEVLENFKFKREIDRLYKRKLAEKELYLKTNRHEWISMNICGRKRLVCKNTGWCPEFQGFVPTTDVSYHLKMIEVEDIVQDRINDKLTELMIKYPLKFFEMRDIADEVLKTQNSTIKEKLPE
jgi:hypothetical protein